MQDISMQDLKGTTFNKWIRYRIIQISIFTIVLFSIGFWHQSQTMVFEFWIEIFAVFFALIFGFYYDRAHETIGRENKNEQVLNLFYKELENNKVKIPIIFSAGCGSYLHVYLQTTVWEVYHESLGELDPIIIDELTSIYYKINLLNHYILEYNTIIILPPNLMSNIFDVRNSLVTQVNAYTSAHARAS